MRLNRGSRSQSRYRKVKIMSDNWTSRRIRKALGVQKCNGSWEAAVEELTMDQVISIAKEKSSDLTGADIRAMAREVIGTCQSMRVCVDGMRPKKVIQAMDAGDYDGKFN